MDTIALDKQYIANTYARQEVVFTKGSQSTLYDDKGKEYIDFGSGIAVTGLGQGNHKWLDAVIGQLSTLAHTSNLYHNEPSVRLAKTLIERTDFSKVFFCNSGAEANECAIKTARKYANDKGFVDKYEIITLQKSFHGRTIATLSATGQDSSHKYFAPFCEGFVYADAQNFDDIEKKVSDKTCAIMLELIQGEGGVIPLDKQYVKNVAKLCKEKDILLIVDEVQTGNGRTGTLYAYMQYGVLPDILTTAKGLGNGLPIGCTMFNEKTQNVLKYGDHGSTFGANPVVCAGAVATLEQIDGNLLKEVMLKSEMIKNALKDCSKIKSITGMGLMIGIEVDNAKEIVGTCLNKGLVVLTAKDKLRLLPALNISYEELNKGLKILSEVLK
ncbi:MAG TPA: aspartate aminotransferase family protein [Clostridia bacterium]|nr:aspartate aminotransferase family protein [Clostridia bacterium]